MPCPRTASASSAATEAHAPLVERNAAGRWADGSHVADTVYDRRHGIGTRGLLKTVPLHR